VRDMGCPPEDALRLRRETSEGKILGPRMIVACPLIRGPLPFQMPLIVSVHNKVEASRAVINLKGQGVDFIKVQDVLPRDLYFYGRMLMRKQLEVVAALKRAGVGVMAGTDLPLGSWSLHEELSLLVEGGLTPLEALQTATRNPAEFLGKLDSLGAIEEGKIADLVLLEANPFEDIRNTRKIYAVILGGKMIQKSSLSEIGK
jgi:imidazolonepropionase-like amidohydrolase